MEKQEYELELSSIYDNADEQELQDLKENLLTRTEELRNLLRALKFGSNLLFSLDVLESEIESD